MPKLRRLSGPKVIRILEGFGFVIHAQAGSHVKLRRVGSQGQKQTLTVPSHRELDTGTLRAIIDPMCGKDGPIFLWYGACTTG